MKTHLISPKLPMIILSWNIRGAGAKIKRRVLRKLLTSQDPWIVFIQESKLESLPTKASKTLWNSDDIDYCASPSLGTSGGLITLWRKPFFNPQLTRVERNWIAIEGTLILDSFHCTLVNIYNSCDPLVRADTWMEIVAYCYDSHSPCLIAGDFNEILSPNDRGSGVIDPNTSQLFKNFISNLHLIEIPPSDGKFTWFRGSSMSKLDRFFVQSEWITKFPLLNSSILPRNISDHCPIILKSCSIDWGPRPFRFQDAWLTHKGCLEIINQSWKNAVGLSLMGKLKKVKHGLKTWNSNDFGNIDSRIAHFETEIHNLDNLANIRPLNEEEVKQRSSAQLDLWNWLKKREIYWAQNSRIQWLKHGDMNSKFFHTYASIRRNRNNIYL